jgi:MFS family permease
MIFTIRFAEIFFTYTRPETKNMNFFDNLTNFKTDENGDIVFFPNGFWGSGYIVPNLEEKQKIQRSTGHILRFAFFLTWFASIGLGFSLFSTSTWRWIFITFFIAALIGIGLWVWRTIMRLTEMLVKRNVKLSVLEAHTQSAHSMSFTFLFVLGGVSCLFTMAGYGMATSPQFHPEFYGPAGVAIFIFGSLGFIFVCYWIALKIKARFFK